MHKLICSNMRLSRSVLTRNVLKKLMGLRVGTNDVVKCARIIKRQNVRNQYDERLIRDMMRSKVNDAEYDEQMVRNEFVSMEN